jgi:hypothetical protein
MEARKSKLGAGHASMLTSIVNFTATYWEQDRLDEVKTLVDVLEMSKDRLGTASKPGLLYVDLNFSK